MMPGATGRNRKSSGTKRPGLLICLCMLAAHSLFAAELSLKVEANRRQLYLGESVLISVTVSGISNPPKPLMSAIRNCKIRPLRKQSHSQIDFKTGKIHQKTVFPYELTPNAAGPFIAGPISVAYDGKTTTVRGPVLQVAGVNKQDWVEITISASRESVIIDEPFEITASISMRALPGAYANHHPLDPRQPPSLSIPFLREIDGLKGPDLKAYIQKLVISQRDQPGFSINDIKLSSSPFPGMFSFDMFPARRLATFSLPKRTITRGNTKYHSYEIKLDYVPKQEGNYTFGPIEFKGPAVVNVAPGGRIVSRPTFAVGPATVVRVIPPPEDGRPASFIGAVGSELAVSAELDAQTCNVGDPLILTLEISGKINMNNITPPMLNRQAALTENFRIYDDTLQSESRNGRKIYSYTVRPTRAGTYEFPAVALSFYDVGRQAYRTVYSQPLPIRARKTAEVGASDVINVATNRLTEVSFASGRDALSASPITMTFIGATFTPLTQYPRHLIIAAAGPCLYGLVAGIRGVHALSRHRRRGRRRRRAGRVATARLRHASRQQDGDAAIREISSALREYLADTFEVSCAGLTPADAARLLMGIETGVAREYTDLFEMIFNAEFSESLRRRIDTSGAARDALMLVQQIELQRAKREPRKDIDDD